MRDTLRDFLIAVAALTSLVGAATAGFAAWQSTVNSHTIADLGTELRAEMREGFAELRAEMRKEIAELRAEMRAEIAALREEMRADIATVREELRADIATVREELRADIATVREELRADIATVREGIAELRGTLATTTEIVRDHVNTPGLHPPR